MKLSSTRTRYQLIILTEIERPFNIPVSISMAFVDRRASSGRAGSTFKDNIKQTKAMPLTLYPIE